MTEDEIIEMARQAATGMPGFTPKTKNPTGAELEFYKRLTNLAAAKEREACAKLCDSTIHDSYIEGYTGHRHSARRECAAAIRARGEQA